MFQGPNQGGAMMNYALVLLTPRLVPSYTHLLYMLSILSISAHRQDCMCVMGVAHADFVLKINSSIEL